jgi:hypothetical protein
MLEPLNRRHLLESLRPPAGYDLDQAIGTTFSLDLMTLLTVPLAFALCDIEDDDGKPLQDPLALLEAIRRYSDRTHIFCQAGGICLPRGNKLFLSHLESVVHEVTAPKNGGIFHPKVWVLRFASPYEDDPLIYRVLVLSRNLTFDRSWDTLLVLEGELRDRERAIRQSGPLGDFVAALPGMMTGRSTKGLRTTIDMVAHELRRVRFDLPPGFEAMEFHPLGLPESGDWWFDGRIQRMLTISPFLDPHTASELGDPADGDVLVSRLDQLQQLPESTIKCFDRVYFLPPDAEPEPDGDDDEEQAIETLSGLHAKLFVADDGWKARIWTGSANATSAAMRRNVEFLVELTGKKSFCGVEAVLSQAKGETRFADLLSVYTPQDQPPKVDDTQAALDRCKLQLRVALASSGIHAVVTPEDGERFSVRVLAPKIRHTRQVSGLTLKMWPVTLHEHAARNLDIGDEEGTTFAGSSFESLTTFFAFDLHAEFSGTAISDRFVLNVPAQGMPDDRRERVLRALLKNRSRVLQFLLFLLAEDGDIGAYLTGKTSTDGGETDPVKGLLHGTSLLEPLMMALHRDPEKIDRVAKVVDDLVKTPEGRDLLPDGLMEIWEPVLVARKELHK